MIADMLSNKKRTLIVTKLFTRDRKINIFNFILLHNIILL